MPDIILDDIDDVLAAEVAGRQPGQFTTYDVSRDPAMLARHGHISQAQSYNGLVGKRLRRLQKADGTPLLVDLGKRKVGTSKTNVWRLAVAQDVPLVQMPAQVPTKTSVLELGPQSSGDAPFTRQMRRHQSWYRAEVLKLPYGVGPQRGGNPYGNMLTPVDAERGANFLTPAIHDVARRRLAKGIGVIEPYRLLHNMLSSQPMCFNLFGPLVDDLGLATRLLSALLPGEVQQVEAVRIEWAPEPASAFLGDRTAFDAFIAYRQPDGQRAFIGFETKLTEPFSQSDYDGPAYRRWMDEQAPWLPGSGAAATHRRHNQLWRDHLLAVALARQPGWAKGRLALVRHSLDRECEATVAAYRRLLRQGDDTFVDLRLDAVVEVWGRVLETEAERAWLEAFRLRYLDLAASGS